jgi:hypothetical protein
MNQSSLDLCIIVKNAAENQCENKNNSGLFYRGLARNYESIPHFPPTKLQISPKKVTQFLPSTSKALQFEERRRKENEKLLLMIGI